MTKVTKENAKKMRSSQVGGVSSRTHKGPTEGAVGDPAAELDEETQEEEEQDILNPDMDYDEAAFAAELEASQKKLPVRHAVHMEPLESRAQEMVIEAMQRTLIKFRAMGIATNRLHSDRAKELLSRQMRKWCTTMGISQTFTAGDDPASNGHIESEVNQLKRKTRVKLAEAGCGREAWPMAMRYATEERRRQQLEALGVPMLPISPSYRHHVPYLKTLDQLLSNLLASWFSWAWRRQTKCG